MKYTWKKIGHFVSLLDLKREIIYLRKYQHWRRIAIKMGLKWAVPQIKLYFKNSEGETVEKMWDYNWKLLHEEYKLAKFAFVEFGMLGWTNVATDSQAYKSGHTKQIGKWNLKLWDNVTGEMEVLSQNEYVQDLITRFYIRQLQEGKIPWRQEWKGQDAPQNLETGQTYRGINLLTALYSGGTYFLRKQQILDLGGTIVFDPVKWPMIFYKWYTFVMVDSKVTPVNYLGGMWMDDWGKIYDKAKVKKGWFLRHFYIYDVEKTTTGLEYIIPDKVERMSFDDKCEQILSQIQENLLLDCIVWWPSRHDMKYNMIFQKIVAVATSRLNYPDETGLIKEFAVTFLCSEGNVSPPEVERPTEFIESALNMLKNDRKQLIKAAQIASKVVDYILNRTSYEYYDD